MTKNSKALLGVHWFEDSHYKKHN